MKNKVLIVVDMQNGFMKHKNYIQLAEKINKLLLKNNYKKIILTKFINKKHSLYEKHLNWSELEDCKSQDFFINVPTNAVVFEKTGYGLTNEQIETIKKLKVDTVDVCGLQTDACVYAICFQLFDNKIFPNILINYCETDPKRKIFSEEILIHQFGRVDYLK